MVRAPKLETVMKTVIAIAALVVLGAILVSGTLPQRAYDPMNPPADLSAWNWPSRSPTAVPSTVAPSASLNR